MHRQSIETVAASGASAGRDHRATCGRGIPCTHHPIGEFLRGAAPLRCYVDRIDRSSLINTTTSAAMA